MITLGKEDIGGPPQIMNVPGVREIERKTGGVCCETPCCRPDPVPIARRICVLSADGCGYTYGSQLSAHSYFLALGQVDPANPAEIEQDIPDDAECDSRTGVIKRLAVSAKRVRETLGTAPETITDTYTYEEKKVGTVPGQVLYSKMHMVYSYSATTQSCGGNVSNLTTYGYDERYEITPARKTDGSGIECRVTINETPANEYSRDIDFSSEDSGECPPDTPPDPPRTVESLKTTTTVTDKSVSIITVNTYSDGTVNESLIITLSNPSDDDGLTTLSEALWADYVALDGNWSPEAGCFLGCGDPEAYKRKHYTHSDPGADRSLTLIEFRAVKVGLLGIMNPSYFDSEYEDNPSYTPGGTELPKYETLLYTKSDICPAVPRTYYKDTLNETCGARKFEREELEQTVFIADDTTMIDISGNTGFGSFLAWDEKHGYFHVESPLRVTISPVDWEDTVTIKVNRDLDTLLNNLAYKKSYPLVMPGFAPYATDAFSRAPFTVYLREDFTNGAWQQYATQSDSPYIVYTSNGSANFNKSWKLDNSFVNEDDETKRGSGTLSQPFTINDLKGVAAAIPDNETLYYSYIDSWFGEFSNRAEVTRIVLAFRSSFIFGICCVNFEINRESLPEKLVLTIDLKDSEGTAESLAFDMVWETDGYRATGTLNKATGVWRIVGAHILLPE